MIYLLHRLTVWNYRRKRAAACPRRLRRLPTTDAIIIAFVVASACYFCAHIVWYFIR